MSPIGTDTNVVPFTDPGVQFQHDDSPLVLKMLRFARQARDNGFPIGIEESMDARIWVVVRAVVDSCGMW